MKSIFYFLLKVIAILLALSTVVFSIAVFRYEIEELFERLRERCGGSRRSNDFGCDDEYSDFADV